MSMKVEGLDGSALQVCASLLVEEFFGTRMTRIGRIYTDFFYVKCEYEI
jgi:hypothetical protein